MMKYAVPGFAPLGWDSNDPETILHGLRSRLLQSLPIPVQEELDSFAQFVDSMLSDASEIRMISFDEWLENTNYNGEMKQKLRDEHDAHRDLFPTEGEEHTLATFMKSEFYLKTAKACRLINPRCLFWRAWAGPIIKSIERYAYHHVWRDGENWVEFVKTYPVKERPALMEALANKGSIFTVGDYTSFESGFNVLFQEACENRLFRKVIPEGPIVHILLSSNSGYNKLETRVGIAARMPGYRMSGDMHTSLGNGFANAMLALYVAHKTNTKLCGYVEGDDSIFATDKHLTSDIHERLGFKITMQEVGHPGKAAFCGLVFAPGNGDQIIRDPLKFLTSFGWTCQMINAGESVLQELTLAKAMSTLAETPNCPIVSELAYLAYSTTKHLKPRFLHDGFHAAVDPKTRFAAPMISDETRSLFAEVFGITIQQQLVVEGLIRKGDFFSIQQHLPPPPAAVLAVRRYLVAV